MKKVEISFSKNDAISLNIDEKALAIMMMTQFHPKGAPKGKKRLIRIRQNLFRELKAFNKEIKRHRFSL